MFLISLELFENAAYHFKEASDFLSKASHLASNFLKMSLKSLKIVQKTSHCFKKASTFLKMSSKSYVIFEKASDIFIDASISLKMSSKGLVIFIKASHL
jgi:hypothetical protein